MSRFEEVVLCHLDAAYNLAKWLTTNAHDADDAVQEACMRAHRSFDTFRGGDARAWLLSIVRNTCFTLLAKRRDERNRQQAFEVKHEQDQAMLDESNEPSSLLLRATETDRVRKAIAALPVEFREMIVLREMEQMSYKEVAAAAGIPIGTVMSRLARARDRLAVLLTECDSPQPAEASHGLH